MILSTCGRESGQYMGKHSCNTYLRKYLGKSNVITLHSTLELMILFTRLQAVAGMGTDNHLLGLRETAKEMKMETPDIFSDETYHISNHFILSTSQVRALTNHNQAFQDIYQCWFAIGCMMCVLPGSHDRGDVLLLRSSGSQRLRRVLQPAARPHAVLCVQFQRE